MKFKVLSDLHLEFDKGNPWKPKETDQDKNTVLLLAGDIHLGTKALPWIEEMCERFNEVVYILGNHEFYNHEWFTVKSEWLGIYKSKSGTNFTFLDDDVLYLEKVRIIGGTLWTRIVRELTKESEYRAVNGGYMMNDYRKVKIYDVSSGYSYDGKRTLSPLDTRKAHLETVKFIEDNLKKEWNGKTIVMTHHLPSEHSVDPMFRGNNLNPYYMTDLDYLMEQYDIDVWIHGHTHVTVDKTINGTRILCNPRGYHGYEVNPKFNEDLIFEA